MRRFRREIVKYLKGIIYSVRLIFVISCIYLLCQLKFDRQILLWGSLALTFVPELFIKISKVKIPIWARVFYTLFLFGSQFLGSFLGAYAYFNWWDAMLHSVSGVFIGYVALIMMVTADRDGLLFKQRKTGLVVLFIFAISIASAGVWEIVEFTGDTFFGTNAQLGSLQDTMGDIICGTIGGGIYAVYIGMMMKHKRKCAIDTLLDINGMSKRNKK